MTIEFLKSNIGKLYKSYNRIFMLRKIEEKYGRLAAGDRYTAIVTMWYFQPAPHIPIITNNPKYKFNLLYNSERLYNQDTEIVFSEEAFKKPTSKELQESMKALFISLKEGAEIQEW